MRTSNPVAEGRSRAHAAARRRVVGAFALVAAGALVVWTAADAPAGAPSVPATGDADRVTILFPSPLASASASAPLATEVAPRLESASAATDAPPRVAVTRAAGEDPVVELGRRLFFDPAASHSKRAACAGCHRPEHGFADPLRESQDDFNVTPRRSQTVLNVAAARALHWDGEFDSLEALILARTGDVRATDGRYQGAKGTGLKVRPVAETLAEEGLYETAFRAAFGRSTPTRDLVAEAIATYVRTLESTTSPFDRYLAGDRNALAPEAERGYELFRGRAGCAECHSLSGARPPFTDGQFHNTGLATRGMCAPRDREERRSTVDRGPFGEGRKRITGQEREARAFKTPSLRDVAVRAPYMHDGSLPTLEAVVRYYAVECGSVADKDLDPQLVPFGRSRAQADVEADVRDLVAFLGSLTGATRAGRATSAWSERARVMRLRILDKASGAPRRAPVALSPGGDALPTGTPEPAVPVYVTPDEGGWIEVVPFASTHVRVTLPGSELRPISGELVPDTCAEGTLFLAVPQDPAQPKSKRR